MDAEWLKPIVMLLIGAVLIAIIYWRGRRKTEMLRRAACKIIGLPTDTSMKEFEKMHRAMRKET